VRDFDPLDYFDRKTAGRLMRADQFALIAAREALDMSGVLGHYGPYDIGVSMGAGAAGMYQGELWLGGIVRGEKSHPGLLRGILPDRTDRNSRGVRPLRLPGEHNNGLLFFSDRHRLGGRTNSERQAGCLCMRRH